MRSDYLKKTLKFCCVINDMPESLSLTDQVQMALTAGATMIRYNGSSLEEKWDELQSICRLCQSNQVPFILLDQPLPAKAMGADGVHLESTTLPPEIVQNILGPGTVIGKTVSHSFRPDMSASFFDYIEVSPFRSTIARSVAGGISNPEEARRAFDLGAFGVTVPDTVFNSGNPMETLKAIGKATGSRPQPAYAAPWRDEFGLIEKILKQAPDARNALIVPPGDDACLLSALSRPVISTDTQKDGVHFRRDWQSPEEIGEKAVSVTLSDLAASYARPVSLFVNLSLPPFISDAFAEDLYRGMGQALEKYGCSLGGGNISGGNELSIDLFAIGEGREVFPKRSEAKPGDNLYATGPLGLARAGLEALLLDDASYPQLVDHFKHPQARFDAAELLAAHGVLCVMDISDGLSGDATHMARASNLSIELDVTAMSFPDELVSFARKYDQRPETFALAGGEEYELLFACPAETFAIIKTSLPEAVRVGRCIPFQGHDLISPGADLSSYRHGVFNRLTSSP
jgi:thiamine-monophosphate kinase